MFLVYPLMEDPQTGNDTDKWGCAIQFTPLLLIESAGQTQGATASIDKLRDEHDKANAQLWLLLLNTNK